MKLKDVRQCLLDNKNAYIAREVKQGTKLINGESIVSLNWRTYEALFDELEVVSITENGIYYQLEGSTPDWSWSY